MLEERQKEGNKKQRHRKIDTANYQICILMPALKYHPRCIFNSHNPIKTFTAFASLHSNCMRWRHLWIGLVLLKVTVTGVLFYFLALLTFSLSQTKCILFKSQFNLNVCVDRQEQMLTYALFHIWRRKSQGEATVSALPKSLKEDLKRPPFCGLRGTAEWMWNALIPQELRCSNPALQ